MELQEYFAHADGHFYCKLRECLAGQHTTCCTNGQWARQMLLNKRSTTLWFSRLPQNIFEGCDPAPSLHYSGRVTRDVSSCHAIVGRQINRESCLIAPIDFSRIYTKRTRGTKGPRSISAPYPTPTPTPAPSVSASRSPAAPDEGKSAWYNELTRTLTPRFTQFEGRVVSADDKMQWSHPLAASRFCCSGHGRHVTSFRPDGWPSPSFGFSFGARVRARTRAHVLTPLPAPHLLLAEPSTSSHKTCQSQKREPCRSAAEEKPKNVFEACPST